MTVRNPLSRTPSDVLRNAAQIARDRARRVITILIFIFRGSDAVSRFLPIDVFNQPSLLRNPQAFFQAIQNFITRSENNPGSDSFTLPDGQEPEPDFTNFAVVLGPPGALPPPVTNDQMADSTILYRIPPSGLNPPRRIQGKVKYLSGFVPWPVEARDNSHDKKLYVDDGLCVTRVYNGLNIPLPSGVDSMSAQDIYNHLYFALQDRGKELLWLNPMEVPTKLKNTSWDSYLVERAEENLLVNRLGQAGRLPKHYSTMVPEDFMSLHPNHVVVYYDGDSHIALAKTVVRANGRRYVKPYGNHFLWGGHDAYFFIRPSKVASDYNIPAFKQQGAFYNLSPEWIVRRIGAMEKPDVEALPDAYLFFDFETISKKDLRLKAYSVSWMFVEVGADLQPKVGSVLDKDVAEGFNQDVNFYYGEDSARHLVEVILDASTRDLKKPGNAAYRKVCGVTFNGSSFDHLLLYEAILEYKEDPRVAHIQLIDFTSEPFWMGTKLTKFEIQGYFSVFDIRQHLGGSLDKCCKDFQTFNRKISGKIPEHEQIQWVFENECDWDVQKLGDSRSVNLVPRDGEPDEFKDGLPMPFREMIAEYNNFDVTALAELFFRYRLNNLVKCGASNHLTPPLTLPSESFSKWEEYAKPLFKIEGCKILQAWNPIDLNLYKEIRSLSVAGRTQCFHEPQRVKETCVSMDVTSLYPYVMAIAPVYYPMGHHHVMNVNWGAEETKAKFPQIKMLGLFKCRVVQAHLQFENLPYIIASKRVADCDNLMGARNNWHEPVVEETWITTPEVEMLLKHNCKVRVSKMVLWEDKVRSIDLFGNLAELMKIKNAEDKLGKKHPEYNGARRNAAKLASNALYGKMMEGFHVDKRLTVDFDEYQNISFDASPNGRQEKYTYCSAVYPQNGQMVVDVKLNPAHKGMKDKQRPVAIGMFILSYSRMYMYEHAYSVLGKAACLYTDTDAIKCRLSDYEATLKPYFEKTPVPHWPDAEKFDPNYKTAKLVGAKVYGAFENELDGDMEDNAGLYIIAKKVWACVPRDGDVKKWKCKGKAITMKDIILTEEEKDELKTLQKESVLSYIRRAKKLYRDKSRMVKNNPERFYESLLKQGKAYVLKSDIRKNVTQMSRQVEWDGENDPRKILNHYASMSQVFRVLSLDPKTHQEVVEIDPWEEIAEWEIHMD